MDTISHTTTALPASADRAQRYDGWTPDRQRAFLEAIAEGNSVGDACRLVGMAPSSAYALRRRAAGANFALGWRAANLLAREKIADTLLSRAIGGQVETVTRPDGATYSRHRYDNRLASTMLARLDRFADKDAGEATHHAARLVAAEFDGFLDLIDRDEGPARTGIFLAARIAGDEVDPDLGAVLSLARADRWLRTGHGAASEIDTRDLDPDARDHWTAEQWARAHAAGMVVFAAPPEPLRHSPLSPLHPDQDPTKHPDRPVWWDSDDQHWRTRFAPPADFDGEEDGDYGDESYSRTLSTDENDAMEACCLAQIAAACAEGAPERDAWFADLARRHASAVAAAAAAASAACVTDSPDTPAARDHDASTPAPRDPVAPAAAGVTAPTDDAPPADMPDPAPADRAGSRGTTPPSPDRADAPAAQDRDDAAASRNPAAAPASASAAASTSAAPVDRAVSPGTAGTAPADAALAPRDRPGPAHASGSLSQGAVSACSVDAAAPPPDRFHGDRAGPAAGIAGPGLARSGNAPARVSFLAT